MHDIDILNWKSKNSINIEW